MRYYTANGVELFEVLRGKERMGQMKVVVVYLASKCRKYQIRCRAEELKAYESRGAA